MSFYTIEFYTLSFRYTCTMYMHAWDCFNKKGPSTYNNIKFPVHVIEMQRLR